LGGHDRNNGATPNKPKKWDKTTTVWKNKNQGRENSEPSAEATGGIRSGKNKVGAEWEKLKR